MDHPTSACANAFTSYSPFFSSGLLAPNHVDAPLSPPSTPRAIKVRVRSVHSGSFSDASEPWDDIDSPSSCDSGMSYHLSSFPSGSESSCPSSPGVPYADDSVMDIDPQDLLPPAGSEIQRSVTPTQQFQEDSTTPIKHNKQPVPAVSQLQIAPSSPSKQQPRLRRRRSSLTLASSPMNAIRSPVRAAGNAFHIQNVATQARSRSGSVTMDMATEGNSMVGRLRSGSLLNSNASGSGTASVASSLVSLSRPRRLARRIPSGNMPLPALLAPPPTSPLPPTPIFTSAGSAMSTTLRPSNLNVTFQQEIAVVATSAIVTEIPTNVKATSARARGLSVSSSALDGMENRIDEDMKENN